jgi:hypothetical protein
MKEGREGKGEGQNKTKKKPPKTWGPRPTIRENQQLVTDEQLEFEK